MPVIGIDLGGTQLRVAVADDRGRLRTTIREPTEARRGREHVIGRIVSAVERALREDGTPAQRVTALGLGMPGPVDPDAGLVISPANLPGFRNVPLNRVLTRRTGIRSYLHHDAHLAALGEHRRGAARGASELIYVTVSTGIGAGLILRNQLYAGAHGDAGEIGHIVVQRGGPLCRCGNHGCVEAISSGTGIATAAARLAPEHQESLLHRLETSPTAADVARAARRGDALALQILDTAGAYLGIALGTLINLFNPELIVLGGSVLKAGSAVLKPMRASMMASSWASARKGLRIVRPALGDDVGLIGAVEFARIQAAGNAGR
jgi:glucokinase